MSMDLDQIGGTCLICGAVGARHYGTVACLGCKGFFRRSILLNKVYKCIRNKTCPITPQTRNGCHYCRLQKCFAVGMKTSYLQGSRQKNGDKQPRLPDISPKNSPTPPFVLVNQCLAKQSNRCVNLGSLGVLKKWPDNSQTSDVINYLIDVERICDEVFDEQTASLSTEAFAELCTVELDPDLAISEPGRIAPRIDINWEPCQPFLDESVIKPIWCRLATYFFDYSSFVPDLELLDPVEKNRLILSNSTRIMWLTLAYKTVKLCDTDSNILLGLGWYYTVDANPEKTAFNEIIKIMYRDCIEPMRELQTTMSEYSILKSIYFFSPVSNLSDRSLQIISRIRDKYIGILNDHLLNESLCSYELALQRITSFMGILQVMEVTSNRFDKRMAHLAVINKAGMRGRLTYEAHVRTE